jgi:hypothetical protein
MRPLLKTRRLHPLQPGKNDIPLKTWRTFLGAPPAAWSPLQRLQQVTYIFRSSPRMSAV